MNVGHTLICFFFLTLRDGNTGLINAEISVHTGTEGGNITVECSFTFSGSRKIFCKEECEGKDILVETTGDRAQSGRYSIEYKEGSFPLTSTLLYVSITKLTKLDSGRYRCSLARFLIPDSSEEFEIRVTDAPITSKPNWTLRPFSTSVPSASTLKTTQSLRSSSGSSTPSSASTLKTTQRLRSSSGSSTPSSASTLKTTQRLRSSSGSSTPSSASTLKTTQRLRSISGSSTPSSASTLKTTQSLRSSSGSSTPSSASTLKTTQSLRSSSGSSTPSSASTLKTTQSLRSSSGSSTPSSASTLKTTRTPAAATGVLPYLGLILGVMIVVFLAAVLIFCRKRASKPKEPPAESEYANVTEPNRVYEEIREEDRQSRAPPVEISTLYTYAKYTKPNGVEPTDDYSLATAASSQKKTEDDSSNLTSSQVDFSNHTAASLHSAPCGDADNTVYSVPRVEASSGGSHAEDASPPLYSTVTLHQL
ncbi:putative protein TPRXL isoform X2 [Siniperca chuatsi]|uniref:putative protein TPRXL isoform X2 n=1 Tax=Siniperca chuatsi TaxID=119488 RepID=UPI001CE0E6A4|nr:putative protein TPRXL isoform X2 [Siniperca chuatsi]